MKLRLEEVFKTSGVPTHTFVESQEYTSLLVSLRTPGRGVIVEGPSGIGKTTAVIKALEAAQQSSPPLLLSGRKREDIELIRELPDIGSPGVVIIDDFHRLPEEVRDSLADLVKLAADEEREDTKLVLVGISKAGQSLLSFGDDVAGRIDTITFESNPDSKVEELLRKGEKALNVSFGIREQLVAAAHGSFFIAQLLAQEVCKKAGVLECAEEERLIELSFPAVASSVYSRLEQRFRVRTERFCRGTKFRPEGRAPYLWLLNWLAESDEWTIQISEELRKKPSLSGSVTQVVDKGYLARLVDEDEELSAVLHFDGRSKILSVEDPQFVYYLRGIPWNQFARRIGFTEVSFLRRYDFALSFAGPQRKIAEKIFEALEEREIEVFYDFNEQHRILAEDIEEYLRPIYQSEAQFVVCLLSKEYPERIWTQFESKQFAERMDQGEVVPLLFEGEMPSVFDRTRSRGAFVFQRDKDWSLQVNQVVELLVRKLMEEGREIVPTS